MADSWLLMLCFTCMTCSAYALMDLKEANFKTILSGLPEDQMTLIEFYASWCPACQRFKPTYEKVGAFFDSPPATDPKVVVARVDCAEEVALCGKFKVEGYPCMKLGFASAFVEHKEENLTTFTSSKRTPESIVAWVATHTGASFTYEQKQQQNVEVQSASKSSQPSQYKFGLQDVEVATVQLFSQATLDLTGTASRTALETVVGLFASAHPSHKCSQAAKKLIDSYSTLWPAEANEPTQELLKYEICGPSPPQHWVACADNNTNTRGFTCGLWMLLHSVSTRVPADQSGRVFMDGLSAFVNHFFKCTMCAEHFKKMMAKENADGVDTKRDAVLWIWRAHNLVNGRLATLDKTQEAGSSSAPKVQWPTVDLCPSCRLPSLTQDDEIVKWSEDEVYAFLLRFYGSDTAPAVKITDASTLAAINASKKEVAVSHRKDLSGNKRSTTAGQFTRGTLFFLVLLLAIWYTAARVFQKHRHPYRRTWAYER